MGYLSALLLVAAGSGQEQEAPAAALAVPAVATACCPRHRRLSPSGPGSWSVRSATACFAAVPLASPIP